ncbi:hypothetical protein DAEQUDRAFT_737008 [Daedalea quercina L-15889]|uniref:Uncharacterized protein n=1 Tax=Daedalea quercina L-15889 TaxID=1314783 RepID=A0A165RVV7_9APHY|nr:hypothetical protein DAEQUDRAFT_737008 [Daedalea quercina L-15889]
MVNTRRKQYGTSESQLLQQNKILQLLQHYTPDQLQHMTVSATPNGQGVHLRWHEEEQAAVEIPALQLLALAGQDAANLQGGHQPSYEAVQEDIEGEHTEVPVPQLDRHRSPTEPIDMYYDPSPLRRGMSVDADARNAEHCAEAWARMLARNEGAAERYKQACEAGVFDTPSPSPAASAYLDADLQSRETTPHSEIDPMLSVEDSQDVSPPGRDANSPLSRTNSLWRKTRSPTPFATPTYAEWVHQDPETRRFCPERYGPDELGAQPEFVEGSSSGRRRLRRC